MYNATKKSSYILPGLALFYKRWKSWTITKLAYVPSLQVNHLYRFLHGLNIGNLQVKSLHSLSKSTKALMWWNLICTYVCRARLNNASLSGDNLRILLSSSFSSFWSAWLAHCDKQTYDIDIYLMRTICQICTKAVHQIVRGHSGMEVREGAKWERGWSSIHDHEAP